MAAWIVGLVLVVACGAGTWLVLADRETAPGAPVLPGTDGLASRADDAVPVTAAELFGTDTVTVGGTEYRVLGTEEPADCGSAAAEPMAGVLAEAGCSQVVRATVITTDGDVPATVGVVNLVDSGAAHRVRDRLASGDGGGFTALRCDGGAEKLGLGPTVLGFNVRGHYLLYTVVGRNDGTEPSRDDDTVAAVVSDLVDVYLVDRLEERRSAG